MLCGGKGAAGGTSVNSSNTEVKSSTTGTITFTSNPLRILRLGESATFGGLTILLKSITEDSRCPKDVYCIQAGKLAALLQISLNGKTYTEPIDSIKPLVTSGFTISLDSIDPVAIAGQKDFSKYKLTFRILPN